MRACSPSPTSPTSTFTVPAESAVATRRAQGCEERERTDLLVSAPAHPRQCLDPGPSRDLSGEKDAFSPSVGVCTGMRGSSRAQERKLFLVQKVPLAPAQDLIELGDAASARSPRATAFLFDGRQVEHPVIAPAPMPTGTSTCIPSPSSHPERGPVRGLRASTTT